LASADAFYAQLGQGFFVKSRTGGGTINFTPEMQTHQTDAAFKTGVVKWPEIKLNATLDSLRNSTLIRFNEKMSNGLDFGYDAGTYKSGLDIYTKLVDDNGVDFGIQALPLTPDVEVVIPLGLESNTKGSISLSVELRDLPTDFKVAFEDRESGIFIPITKSGSLSTINVGTKSKLEGRFFIHITYSKNIDNITPDPQDWQIYNANGQICILGTVSDDTFVSISDLLGKEVGHYNLQQSLINYIPCPNLRNGVYLVTIRQKSSIFTKKIMLMNR
jgi:hypothetical protein